MCSCCPEPLDLRIPSKRNEHFVPVKSDDVSDSEVKYGQPQVNQEQNFYPCDNDYSSSYIPFPHDSSFIEIHNRPGSTNSDEGFVEPEEFLPFNGHFEDSKVSDVTPPKKRHRKPLVNHQPKKRRTSSSPPPGERKRRKPGRKPGQVSNVLHLWEFMRDLLHEPQNSAGIIEWISPSEGVFRVIDSAEVARRWGEKKNNKKAMTYEKLSRSLRYSRLEGYFDNLPKDKNYPKKLCFKFGPKSKDWSLSS